MHNPGTNVAALSTLFQGLLRTWRAKWPVACLQATGLRCAPGNVVPKFPRPGWCARGRVFWRLSVGTRSACCRPDFSQLLMGHTEQPISAIAPNLVLVQLLGQFPELPLLSPRSRNVCHSDRLLLILCGLHRLLQRYVHHADEVSRQIRPSSPTGAVLLSEPVGHQDLWLHQLDARPGIDHTAECSQFLMHRLLASRNSL